MSLLGDLECQLSNNNLNKTNNFPFSGKLRIRLCPPQFPLGPSALGSSWPPGPFPELHSWGQIRFPVSKIQGWQRCSLSMRLISQSKLFHLQLKLQTLSSSVSFFFYSQCSPPSPITVTTEVTFVDTTVYPDPPRGAPQPQWKFPFGFFTRGTAELDGHTVFTSSGAEEVTWSLMLFTVMLLTGLEFFTR